MAERLPYFPMYPLDILNDENVLAMDAETFGFYMKFLLRAWVSDVPGTLPDNRKILAEISGISQRKLSKIFSLIFGKVFLLKGDRWVNPRLLEEAEKAFQLSNKQRDKANKRWAKPPDKPAETGDATALPRQCPLDTDTDTDTKNPPVVPQGDTPTTDEKPPPLEPEEKPVKTPKVHPDVPAVWATYRECLTACNAELGRRDVEPKLTPKREALLTRHLAIYTREDLQDTARGMRLSPWHMGRTRDGEVKLDPETVFNVTANVNQIEKLAGLFRNSNGNGKPKADPDETKYPFTDWEKRARAALDAGQDPPEMTLEDNNEVCARDERIKKDQRSPNWITHLNKLYSDISLREESTSD